MINTVLETRKEMLEQNEKLLNFISILISSDPFARLSKTTQVANMTESNPHLKNRLSHSLDVAEIAGNILAKLQHNLNMPLEDYIKTSNLVRAISYAHDIGHTGGGHLVERMLHKFIPFEGNNNNQIVLEKEFKKLNVEIPQEVLVGLIKYPYKYNELGNFKGLYEEQYQRYIPLLIEEYTKQKIKLLSYKNENYIDSQEYNDILNENKALQEGFNHPNMDNNRLISTDIRLFETKLMEIADDITYLTHDLKDFVTHFTPKGFKLSLLKEFDKYSDIKDSEFQNVIQLLNNFTPENAKITTLLIRDYLIKNVDVIDGDNNMSFSHHYIDDLLMTIRAINMQYYIKPIDTEYIKVLDIEKFLNIYMSNIDNKTFLNEFIVSDTYKYKILESTDVKDKQKYMGYYIAEMTDDWMIHRMRLFNCVAKNEDTLSFENVKKAVSINLFEEMSKKIINSEPTLEKTLNIG